MDTRGASLGKERQTTVGVDDGNTECFSWLFVPKLLLRIYRIYILDTQPLTGLSVIPKRVTSNPWVSYFTNYSG